MTKQEIIEGIQAHYAGLIFQDKIKWRVKEIKRLIKAYEELKGGEK